MRPQRLLLAAVALTLAPATAQADVRVDIALPSGLPGDGVLVHAFGADGSLVGGASTVAEADGSYRIATTQLDGAVFPLRIAVDRRVDGCTGGEAAPAATLPADGSSVSLELPLTAFCAAPGGALPRERIRIDAAGSVHGLSGGSAAAMVFTPPSADGGTVAVETADGLVLDTVPVDPQRFYAGFTLHAPPTAVTGDLFLRWSSGGRGYRVRIGSLDVQPAQPVQPLLGVGPVDVLVVLDASGAGAANDPAGGSRADAVRLLRAMLRPGDRLGVVAASGTARVLRGLSAAPGFGALALAGAGAFDYDVALAAAADALEAGGQPLRPKVVVLLTGSDTASAYGDAHLRLARTAAGHRWPVVVVPTAFAASVSEVAARIATDTGGFLTVARSPEAAPGAVLEAWARLHGGRRSLATTVSGSQRAPSSTLVRGIPGRPLRVLATWRDGSPAAAVTVTDPTGRRLALRPLRHGVLALEARARAGAYRVTLVPLRARSAYVPARAELTVTVG